MQEVIIDYFGGYNIAVANIWIVWIYVREQASRQAGKRVSRMIGMRVVIKLCVHFWRDNKFRRQQE